MGGTEPHGPSPERLRQAERERAADALADEAQRHCDAPSSRSFTDLREAIAEYRKAVS